MQLYAQDGPAKNYRWNRAGYNRDQIVANQWSSLVLPIPSDFAVDYSKIGIQLHMTGSGTTKLFVDALFFNPVHQLESYNFPTRFVRHSGFRGRIDPSPSPFADAQFKIESGLGNSSAVSFEAVAYPGRFLRRRIGQYRLAGPERRLDRVQQ